MIFFLFALSLESPSILASSLGGPDFLERRLNATLGAHTAQTFLEAQRFILIFQAHFEILSLLRQQQWQGIDRLSVSSNFKIKQRRACRSIAHRGDFLINTHLLTFMNQHGL